MNNLSGRLVIYLVGATSIFVILFGIRGSASVINPILLATVITIMVLPIPSRLSKRGLPGWLSLVLTILMVVLVLGLVIATVFFSITKLSTGLPAYTASASQWALVIFFFMISAAISMTVLTGINFMVGLGDTLLLILLGVDYAVLWGLLAWFMRYHIPLYPLGWLHHCPDTARADGLYYVRSANRADSPNRICINQRRGTELHPAETHGG